MCICPMPYMCLASAYACICGFLYVCHAVRANLYHSILAVALDWHGAEYCQQCQWMHEVEAHIPTLRTQC